MDVEIENVAPGDGEALERWRLASEAARTHDMPEFPPRTPEMMRLIGDHEFPGVRTVRLLASMPDARPAAAVEIRYPTRENLANAFVFVAVDPRWRRRGIGSLLFGAAVADVRANGRTRIQSVSLWDLPELGLEGSDPGGPAFARHLGFAAALPEVQRRLSVADLDRAALAGLRVRAEQRSSGYRVLRWCDDTPKQYLADLAYLDGRLTEDAPTGDLAMEAEQVDAERFLEAEQALADRGRTRFHAAAVHEASGRLVAWTLLTHEDEVPWHAWQQVTIVDPDHRGHRLGLLVKLANLDLLLEARPGVEAVDTFNAHENGHMVAINEQLGFRPLYGGQNWQLELRPVPD